MRRRFSCPELSGGVINEGLRNLVFMAREEAASLFNNINITFERRSSILASKAMNEEENFCSSLFSYKNDTWSVCRIL